ncbi:MAG TPA: response regulator [Granulicella sp.]|nr:response regulator [Granulicella sp.]
MTQSNEVIYLVDDDLRVREGITALLASHGMVVTSFGSAVEYLQHTRADSAACLILDLNMPQMGGLDLQRQLSGEIGPPIIFMSGYGDIPSTVRAMKAGAIEFLTKPLDEEALLTAIRAAFVQDKKLRQRHAELARLRERLASLTPREREVLPLVVGGLLNKQAAAVLGISNVTLQVHRGQIMRKMAAKSLAELVRMASKLGIRQSVSHSE